MRIYCQHPWITDVPTFCRFYKLPNRIQEELIWDNTNPDIIFSTEHTYYRSHYWKEFVELFEKDNIKVFAPGEALDPDWNLFDYAIGFSNKQQVGDRFIRILSPIDFFRSFLPQNSDFRNPIRTIEDARKILLTKSKFCNFLYSNPEAHHMRDKLFYEISKYKKVDSMGKHLNNVGIDGTGYEGHAHDCIQIKAEYKFSIASENASFYGYTSEKILTSLAANTIPIYWGNPDIAEDINPKCFINVCDFPSMDALIKRIQEIDEDDNLWCEIVSQPWLTDAQIALHKNRTWSYYDRITYLLTGNTNEQHRIAQGTHSAIYRKRVLTSTFPWDPEKPKFPYSMLWFRRLMRFISNPFLMVKNLFMRIIRNDK